MIDWLQNPHADYVIAAYDVAIIGLMGLLIASYRAWRRKQREWHKLQQKRDQ